MLQLLRRDHDRHMTIPLSRYGSVSLAPIYAAMQILMPIPGGRRILVGGVNLFLPHLGALSCVTDYAVPAIDTWLGDGRGMGVPGFRAAGGGISLCCLVPLCIYEYCFPLWTTYLKSLIIITSVLEMSSYVILGMSNSW